MTPEEAAEEVLSGKYLVCPVCQGTPPKVTYEGPCQGCLGWGRVLHIRYLEACAVLGMSYPDDIRFLKTHPKSRHDT